MVIFSYNFVIFVYFYTSIILEKINKILFVIIELLIFTFTDLSVWDQLNPGGCPPPRRFNIAIGFRLNFERVPNQSVLKNVDCYVTPTNLEYSYELTCSNGIYPLAQFLDVCQGKIDLKFFKQFTEIVL